MYVKSLTLKGFKSFASATSMTLEPGITCIVGPNGSGKSNVVDALAWVMGEQGAKSLRGGKMEDVIFAGTAHRPALGRAEVSLTIDNLDGALPIEYTEVTLSRTMFRNGGSEYRINGTLVRLVDVQELLSDSGIGREMHVIVGQGQLDAVLRATPQERRGFIEEAAGVLKHRKRKERALRKLEAMEVDLNRVQDLTEEIRRQLGPLGRQAETARRAVSIQANVRDARLRLLADDLVQLTSTLEQEVADETALIERRTGVQQVLAEATGALEQQERLAQASRPVLATAQEQWYRLSALRERLVATSSLAAERVRLLEQDQDDAHQGRDPEQLRHQGAELREQEQQAKRAIEAGQQELSAAVQARADAEQAYQDEQQRLARLARAAADRREGLATLQGQVGAFQSRIEARDSEIDRLRESLADSVARAAIAERRYGELESSIADTEAGEVDLDAQYEEAVALLEAAQAEWDQAQQKERELDRERGRLQARIEALELSVSRKDGAAALLQAPSEHPGVVGAFSGVVRVQDGDEAAIAAVLGAVAEGVVVTDLAAARRAIESLREQDAGRVSLLIGDAPEPGQLGTEPLPAGCRWAHEVVTAPPELAAAVRQALHRVVLVADPSAVPGLLARDLIGVTRDGDVYGLGRASGGSSSTPSLLEIQSAVEEARTTLGEVSRTREQTQFRLSQLRPHVQQLTAAAEARLATLTENDAQMAAVAEQLGQLGQTLRSAAGEQERLQQSIARAEEAVEADRHEVAQLRQRLDAAADEPVDAEPEPDAGAELARAAAAARTQETEVRLSLRTTEERARSLGSRADSLEAAVRSELEAREKARSRQERRRREAAAATAVELGARYSSGVVDSLLEVAAQRRDQAEQDQGEREQVIAQLRTRVGAASDELRELTDSVHRDEVARAQQRLRIETLQAKAVEELGIDPAVLTEQYGPHQLIAHVPEAGQSVQDEDFPEPVPFEREVQEKRLRSAERALTQLGKVNPLALEEFAALEERYAFLGEQMEDVKKSRSDLLEIVASIDERVQRVFDEAFHDTAREFEGVFSRLFPGGDGRLMLTDPGDLLTTGIEVEARPPGKKIKRLSLLSGGERSLVAVAFLVAIFKARPSPFYIMDEVEAALDDANLGRLLTLFEELRGSSQLIVITHQKRTMEVADALYGVTMRGDGVTTVVSQRLRDVREGSTDPSDAA